MIAVEFEIEFEFALVIEFIVFLRLVNRFDRVISILILLQSRKVVKAQQISERFDVSLRTVYRDIRTLEEAGVPICGEAGVGYSIAEGYRLPPVIFDESEAFALTAGEKFIANIVDEATAKAYASALAKIRAVLESANLEGVERLDDSIVFRSHPKTYTTKHLSEIFGAISGRWVMRIQYRKPDSMEAEWRDLEPMGCYFDYNNWYLIAWCRLRKDYRTFKVNRIEALKLRAEHFEYTHPSLTEYIERESKSKKALKVEVRFPKSMYEYIENDRFNFGLVQEVDEGESVKMTFLVPDYHLIARWLLMYTKYVEVVNPEALKTLMKELAEDLLKHYSK